jgi:hypothetical protein
MLPWGGLHVFETGIHSLRGDIRFFKYAHPTDPVIDVLYATTVRDLFAPDGRGGWPNIRTTYAPSWDLFAADDPIGAEGAAYDFDKAFDGLMARLSRDEPLSYFSDYRGLMTARSAWDRDATFLYFEPRHVPGGHTRASRNEFVLAAHGRVWAHRTVAVEDTSELHSVVLIDGKGQGKSGGRCPAGRTVAFADTPVATFAAADAAWAYGRVLVPVDRKVPITRVIMPVERVQPMAMTPNDSRVKPSPLPWMGQPWSVLPNWATGCKPAPGKDPGGHGFWLPYNPVQYAFRTCGLVRGKHPYVIVSDDIRKDGEPHDYAWLLQVPGDVALEAITVPKDPAVEEFDIILTDGTDRRLLVRVLQAGARPADLAVCRRGVQFETFVREHRRQVTPYRRLVLPTRGVTGTFRVLLFPFRAGQRLPQTAWNAERTGLQVAWGDQQDTIAFAPRPDGRASLTLQRAAAGREMRMQLDGAAVDEIDF